MVQTIFIHSSGRFRTLEQIADLLKRSPEWQFTDGEFVQNHAEPPSKL